MPTENLPSMPLFRVRLDVPYDFAIAPGFVRNTHCHNFREEKGNLTNAYREPNTGLIMLRPSFTDSRWYADERWEPLTSWLVDAGYWQDVLRLNDPTGAAGAAKLFSSLYNPNLSTWGNLLDNVIRFNLLAAAFTSDTLRTIAKSSFALAPDEGFALFYRTVTDETHRPHNLVQVNFGDLALHLSSDGTGRVYWYRDGLASDALLIEEFPVSSEGDLLNKDGFFTVIPIPGYGLSITHNLSPQRMDVKTSSAQTGAHRGKLVAVDRTDAGGYKFVHPGGNVYLSVGAQNDRFNHVFGFHRIRYNTAETARFLGELFDPGYFPAQAPAAVAALTLPADPARAGSALASVRNKDDSAGWDYLNGDRQGRVAVQLSTTDDRYTPFLVGTGVAWTPEYNRRDTTPKDPDALWSLEFTDDDGGAFSGACVTRMDTEENKRLVERGDATFVVERSDDEGQTWDIEGGGIARVSGQVAAEFDQIGEYYVAAWELSGMERRFSELHKIDPNAFDGISVDRAVNNVLTATGFPQIPLADFPPAFAALTLPSARQQQDWRWGTKFGDSGLEILDVLLLLLRRQNEAYRLRYDWPQQKWVAEARPRDDSPETTWRLTPFDDEVYDPATGPIERAIEIGDGSTTSVTFLVQPPEANLVQAIGLSDINNIRSEMVRSFPLSNDASVLDKDSPDYLGRAVAAFPLFAPISEKRDIDIMGRRVYDAACHRRILATAKGNRYYRGFRPLARATFRGAGRDGVRQDSFGGLAFYLKRRTVAVNYNQEAETVIHTTYQLDSVWEEMI